MLLLVCFNLCGLFLFEDSFSMLFIASCTLDLLFTLLSRNGKSCSRIHLAGTLIGLRTSQVIRLLTGSLRREVEVPCS